jgi:hypothetical protein
MKVMVKIGDAVGMIGKEGRGVEVQMFCSKREFCGSEVWL